jgi:hypothetical protein
VSELVHILNIREIFVADIKQPTTN